MESANERVQDILELKKQYTVLEAQLWLYLVNMKKVCPEQEMKTIIYFYTNNPGECIQCRAQGKLLKDTAKDLNGNTWVFSFEYNIDLDIINAVKKQFNVTKVPTTIIDETTILEGVQKKETFEQYLK